MLSARSFDLVSRTFDHDKNKFPKLKGLVGADLHGLEQDRAIRTNPDETCRRRTIRLFRNKGQSWGFTLQTYGIRNKRTQEVEIMSYVDNVEIDGSAWIAGMQRGDIILSVNGESVESCTHRELVRKVQSSGRELRLVALFEDCCKKVELHVRYLKLKKLLSQKVKELHELEKQERKISQGISLSRLDTFRQSNYSSSSNDWDVYSEIISPSVFDSIPTNRFAFCNQSFSSFSIESSTNSVGNLIPDLNCPRLNNEERIDLNCLRPNSEEGIDIKLFKPNTEKRLHSNFAISNTEEQIQSSFAISNTEEQLHGTFAISNTEEQLHCTFAISNTEEQLHSTFAISNTEEQLHSTFAISNTEEQLHSTFAISNTEEQLHSTFAMSNTEEQLHSTFAISNTEEQLHSTFAMPNTEEMLDINFFKSKFGSTNNSKSVISNLGKQENNHFSRFTLGEDNILVISSLVEEEAKKCIISSLEMMDSNSVQRGTESVGGDKISNKVEETAENERVLLCGCEQMDNEEDENQCTLTGASRDNIQHEGEGQCTFPRAGTENIQHEGEGQCTFPGAGTDNIQCEDEGQCTFPGAGTDNILHEGEGQCRFTGAGTDNIQHEGEGQCTCTGARTDNIQHEGEGTDNIQHESADLNKIIESNESDHHHSLDCESIHAKSHYALFMHQPTNCLTTEGCTGSHSFSRNHRLLFEDRSSTKLVPMTDLKTKEISTCQKKVILSLRREVMEVVHSSDPDTRVRSDVFYHKSNSKNSAEMMELNEEQESFTCSLPDSSMAAAGRACVRERNQQNISNDLNLSLLSVLCNACRDDVLDSDSSHRCQDLLLSSSTDGQCAFHKSQETKDVSCTITSNLTAPPQSLTSSHLPIPTLTHQMTPENVNKKNIINGVLVNDRSYSTRL